MGRRKFHCPVDGDRSKARQSPHKGLEAMGAKIQVESGYVKASSKGVEGSGNLSEIASVGATENLIMAVLAEAKLYPQCSRRT